MNQPPLGLCRSCGAQLPPGGTACARCGAGNPSAGHPAYQPPPAQQPYPGQQPYPAQQPYPGQQPHPGQHWQAPPPWQGPPQPTTPGRGRRTALLVGVGVLVLLLIGGGVFAATRLLGGGDGGAGSDSHFIGMYDGVALREPATAEPEETWSWDAPDPITGALEAGDSLVLTLDSSEVVSLDADGKEEWTTTIDSGTRVSHVVPGHDVLVASQYDVQSLTGLSAEDGEQLWTYDDRTIVAPTEEGVVFTGIEKSGLIDAESGDEVWTVDTPDDFVLSADAGYLLEDDELTKVSLADGEEQWSVTLESDENGGSVSVVANAEMAVVGGEEVVALDAESGDELWTEDGGENGARPSLFSDSRVYLTFNAPEGEVSDSARVFDRDGEVGELEILRDEEEEYFYFYVLPFVSDGEAYAVDYSSGRVFDEELEVVGTYDGDINLAAGGVYVRDEDRLSFFELGSDSPEWTMDAGDAEGIVAVLDERVAVYTEDTVTSYE